LSQLFRTKSIDALIKASEEPDKRLRKTLGPWSLTAFGIGAVIGSGIFILTGTAAASGLAWINAIGNLGGFPPGAVVAPQIVIVHRI